MFKTVTTRLYICWSNVIDQTLARLCHFSFISLRLLICIDCNHTRKCASNQSCWWDLNPWPRPYQGRALPLSYSSNSLPRLVERFLLKVTLYFCLTTTVSSGGKGSNGKSGWRVSNPRLQLGRLWLYHWATPAIITVGINCETQCAAILYFYAIKVFLVSGFSPSFQKINTKS